MNTRLKQVQIALFTRNFNLNDLERAQVFTELNAHANRIFNETPVNLPIPNDAPGEFPRFILSGSEGKFKSNISLLRTDVFYDASQEVNTNLGDILDTQRDNAKNIFSFLLGRGVVINRIGFIMVVEKVLSTEEGTGVDYLRQQFISGDKFPEPNELAFNYNHVGRTTSFDMNNLVTISSKIGNPIVIQTDINTVPEIMNTAAFTIENFDEITSFAASETIRTIDNFPNV